VRLRSALAVAAVALSALGGCGPVAAGAGPVEVRLGYSPNITQATALVGVARGTYAEELGAAGRLSTSTFNAGPAAVEALFSRGLDLAYVGPNPAINAYVQSKGSAIRVIAGATSGGASLVVRPSLRAASDLRGRRLATPQLGGTQDVALRYWLSRQGFRTTPSGGGDVAIVPQSNAQTLQTFRSGAIDGAWVPEPWASRLVLEGGGRVLVDERSTWPDGKFVSANLVVRREFLAAHPDQVRAILRAHVRTTRFLRDSPAEGRRAANAQIHATTGKRLQAATVAAAWANLEFTNDPLAATLREDLHRTLAVGLLKAGDVTMIYDLGLLNDLLRAQGQPEIGTA